MTLVDRADEVAAIEAALDRLGGMPWVVEVVGEPGIGKTRLIGELVARAHGRGNLVLRSRSTEATRDVPFGVLRTALADLVENADLSKAQRAALSPLSPGHGPVSEVARYRAHRAARALLALLAKPNGLVLVLDDLHWVDEDTLGLIAHLLRHPPVAPILLVLAYRQKQVPAQVAAAADQAVSAGQAQRITLEPLSVNDFAVLLGPDVSQARTRELHRETGGNPFYLELLTSRSADETVRDELNGLSPTVRLVSRSAAVAGDPFEPTLVAAIAGTDTTTTLRALDDLLARDLVRAGPDERRLRFRHPLVRQLIYMDSSQDWRELAHRRAATELAKRDAPVVVRAHHIALSAEPGDADAVRELVRGATMTMPEAPATAANWLGVALRLVPEGVARHHILTMAGQALSFTGDLAESRDLLKAALDELPDGESDERATVAAHLAKVFRLLGSHEQARSVLLAELARHPGKTSSVGVARLKLELSLVSVARKQFGNDASLIDDVVDFARRSQDRLLEAAALALHSWAAYMADDLAGAIHSCDTAKAILDGLSDGELAGWIELSYWLSLAERYLDRLDDGLRHADRGIALARATGRNYILTMLLSQRCNILRWQGRLGEALQAAKEGVDVAARLGSESRRGVSLHYWSRMLLAAGDPAEGVRVGRLAVATEGDEPDWWTMNARKTLALAQSEIDRVDRMAEVVALIGGPEIPMVEKYSKPIHYDELITADLATGHLDRARDWARRAEEAIDLRLPTRTGLVQLGWANVLLAGGEPENARLWAEAAAAAFEQEGNQFELARALATGGRAAAALGDSAEAIRRLERAAGLFTACAAPNLAAQVSRDLRQLGRRAAGSGTLTARELEIAGLVAGGATNRQIAEALVISERTVGTHLSRIYAKLGISSRAALAAQRIRDEEG
jgi:DNA-binding CsgD family transcriptional regulator